MPGIAGIISNRLYPENRAKLDSMTGCMLHEKFYNSGTYINEQLGLFTGWVSHTGSFSDCMPAWNEKKDICLIFSGEDYQDCSDVDRLRTGGHRFNSQNASYLVHLYEDRGLKFFEAINGVFSGLVVDLRKQKVFLFNDRYGIGRIYYHEAEDGLY